MSLANAQEYRLWCEEGEWVGHNIVTYKNSDEVKFIETNPSYSETVIHFRLPADLGDRVAINYENMNYFGSVTYFYDANEYSEDQSYIIFDSEPYDLLETYVIMIDSAWTHFSYSMIGGTSEEDALVSINNTKKCELHKVTAYLD